MQTVFISYGGPDEAFAERLAEALEQEGVKTWFFPRDAQPGDKLHRAMRRGIGEHDRVVLVCSKSSLTRRGVLNEIEQTLVREASGGGASVLIPITLDNYVFDDWIPDDPDRKSEILSRVVADFRGTEEDPLKFRKALAKLVRALKAPPAKPKK